MRFLPEAGPATGAKALGKTGGAFLQALPTFDFLGVAAAPLPVADSLNQIARRSYDLRRGAA
jgi:hypothetical protein